jgi:hypothetical protein
VITLASRPLATKWTSRYSHLEALRYRERVVGGCLSQAVARSASAALLVVLVACSGGSGGSGHRAPAKGSTPPTTAAPATIDLSKPIPGGSLHGKPRPPLENTGNDYVAIFKSLTANFRWLTENPNPTLLGELFVPGTPPHDQRSAAYQYLVEKGYRWADEGYQLLDVQVVDAKEDAVSLKVVEKLTFERVVDASGAQVGEVRPHGSRETVNVLLSRGSDGKWRVANSSRIEGSEVQL